MKNKLIGYLKIKRLIILILAFMIMASSLLLIKSISYANSDELSPAEMVSNSEQKLQSQINDLSDKISTLNTSVSQLQSQTSEAATPAASPIDQQAISEIQATAEETKNLTDKIDSLQTEVAEMQGKLKGAETIIGSIPMTMNGLSIVFITNDIENGVIGVNNTSAVQFAVKLINNTGSNITNLDVTGAITASTEFTNDLAPGYPQITDGGGLVSYVFFIQGEREIDFEAYGSAKTGLSIPAGGSVTLRPKITMLPETDLQIPDMTFDISLKTITYDKVATK